MDTEVSSILQLNDDCLWCIFWYFDLAELLIAGSVCQRFEGIAHMFYKNDKNCQSVQISTITKELYLNGIHHPRLGDILRQLEPHMIAMNFMSDSFMKIFNCPDFTISSFSNLQHIKICFYHDFIHEDYANIFPALKQIIITGMLNCDESILSCWFNNSPHLKILKLSYIDLTGECLVGLKGIEELKIDHCRYIEPTFFKQFCQMNPQLKKLSFEFSFAKTQKSNTFLKIIKKYLKNLENLVIYDKEGAYTNYKILRNLPKVTKLHLDFRPSRQFYAYYHLLEYFATNNQIKYLNLTYLSEKSVLNILKPFPYLKVLKLKDLIDRQFEKLFNFISCLTTLEELHIVFCIFESSTKLKDFIEKCKSLRLLNIFGAKNFNSSLLMDIEECLFNRSQMLEIVINFTDLAAELKKEPQSELLKEFLERTKGKMKLTFGDIYLGGLPTKSFHECEEWEGLLL